ncbi:unnamed protein product [Phytomonas sp. EM1]|nr:unnamed protein product [Phytomonas sp. EM1]|eukprot:CCW60512.1 unnamed protein product [Phytomonas sp. isolate EM1]
MKRLVMFRRLNKMEHGVVGLYVSRRLSSDKYVNKRIQQKLLIDDDGHWVEAEIDKNINVPEERYAHQKEMELLKKMTKMLGTEKEEEKETKEQDT